MNKKTVIIIIVALVLVIVAMGVGGFLFLSANKEKEKKVLFYSPGEYFVTNLKDSNSLLKVTVTLAYNKEGVEEELTANNAIIRNAIVFTLRSKTKQDMQALDIETNLSNEICQKLNAELGVDYFIKVYFSDLVIQG